MTKPTDPSRLPELITRALTAKSMPRRVHRLCRLALRLGAQSSEAAFTAALTEVSREQDPILRDFARDDIVDAHLELGQFLPALAVASKMESTYSRAVCYAEVRHAARRWDQESLSGGVDVIRRAEIGLEHAREQLDSDDRAELFSFVRLLESE
jgi:hypothetical protein